MYIRTYVNQYTTRRTVHQKVRFDDTENYVKTWLQWRGFAWFTFRDGAVPWIYVMGVSENRGTPKSSILKGFSVINHPFWGTPIFGSTHISQKLYARRFPPHHTTTSKFYLTINPLENEDIKTTQPTAQTATCGQVTSPILKVQNHKQNAFNSIITTDLTRYPSHHHHLVRFILPVLTAFGHHGICCNNSSSIGFSKGWKKEEAQNARHCDSHVVISLAGSQGSRRWMGFFWGGRDLCQKRAVLMIWKCNLSWREKCVAAQGMFEARNATATSIETDRHTITQTCSRGPEKHVYHLQ